MEQWRPVVGYEGIYEVSDQGRVRSVDREVRASRGGGTFTKAGQLLKPGRVGKDREHQYVCLSRDGKVRNRLVHRLVLEAFVGPCPDGLEALHDNDDATDNRLENLSWGTRARNIADRTRNGKGGGTRATEDHCARGHEWTPETIRYTTKGTRRCAQCGRDSALASYHRRKRG